MRLFVRCGKIIVHRTGTAGKAEAMAQATLTISSKNYSSWSLRGWLLCRIAGLDFEEQAVDLADPAQRQELLLLSPSVRLPRLVHGLVTVWDTLAIAEYLNEIAPAAGLWPRDQAARAHARAICGEMHSGFQNLRSALPMNLRARHQRFRIFSGARPDVERIRMIWEECLEAYGGPWLFGTAPGAADAMYAPVCTRFRTYDVALGGAAAAYGATVLGWSLMEEWTASALAEPEEIQELEVEF